MSARGPLIVTSVVALAVVLFLASRPDRKAMEYARAPQEGIWRPGGVGSGVEPMGYGDSTAPLRASGTSSVLRAEVSLDPNARVVEVAIRERNPVLGAWESQVYALVCSYTPAHCSGISQHDWIVFGYDEARGLILERISIPLQQGAYRESRSGMGAALGTAMDTPPPVVSIVGGNYIPVAERSRVIPRRFVLGSYGDVAWPVAGFVDPLARFVLVCDDDASGLLIVDMEDPSRIEEFASVQAYPYLRLATEIGVCEVPGKGRFYEVMTRYWEDEDLVIQVLVDEDNDGYVDSSFDERAQSVPGRWFENGVMRF